MKLLKMCSRFFLFLCFAVIITAGALERRIFCTIIDKQGGFTPRSEHVYKESKGENAI